MKKLTLTLAILCLAGCLFDKDDKEKKPGYNSLTLKGELEGLSLSVGSFYSWTLPIDTIFPDYPHMWDQETYGTLGVCGADGYLGNADTTDYTDQWMTPGYLGVVKTLAAPADTVHARALQGRAFTHWRLEITCADSIPVPPQ